MRALRLFRFGLVLFTLLVLVTSTSIAQFAPPALPDFASQAASSAGGTLGKPGLTFRYVGMLGESETPYFADTEYLNRPMGLYLDPDTQDIYVTEEQGYRVLRYNSSGVNTLDLGTAGVNYRGDYTFDSAEDVALDGDKNIWVADYSRVAQYSPAGFYLQQIPAENPWETGDDEGRFDRTRGIAFDSVGHMFVSDQYNHRVQVFHYIPSLDDAPVFATILGMTGETGADDTHFNNPGRLAVDSANNLYVLDEGNNRVQRCDYDAGGDSWDCSTLVSIGGEVKGISVDKNDVVYITSWNPGAVYKCTLGSCALLFYPDRWAYDLAVADDGTIYASHPYESVISRYSVTGIYVDDFKGTFHVYYETDGQHYLQPRVNVDAQDNLLIVEYSGQRLIKSQPDGTPILIKGVPGFDQKDDTHFTWPSRAASDRNGRIYVADGDARVQIFNSNGSFYKTLGTGSGTGNYQFSRTEGIAVDASGNIYVSDTPNHRVMIYNSSLVYIGRIGNGTCGPSGEWICGPKDITIDKAGNIYIADGWSNRVLKYNSKWVRQLTLGEAFVWGGSDDNFHFASPEDVAVDGQGRIYVADTYNQRVMVYDPTGVYLGQIGGGYGGRFFEMRGAASVAVDSKGRVYISDTTNARILIFEPGMPGWALTNLGGFGDAHNYWINRLGLYNGYLYASTTNDVAGAEIWRLSGGRTWTQINSGGLGNTNNKRLHLGEEIGGYLYTGTENTVDGGEIYRCATCDGSDWEQVLSGGLTGSAHNSVQTIIQYNGMVYANIDGDDGVIVVRSPNGNAGTWTTVSDPGFGNSLNGSWMVQIYAGKMYVLTAQWGGYSDNTSTGAEVWRCSACDGTDWEQAATAGWGNSRTFGQDITVFNNQLYVSTFNSDIGTQVFRCTVCDGTDWDQVNSIGFDDPVRVSSNLRVYHGKLYAISDDFWESPDEIGIQVFVSENGSDWTPMLIDGFGKGGANGVNDTAVFNDTLYISTSNWITGGEVWAMLDRRMYLPVGIR